MTLARLPLLRILVSLAALAGIAVASVLLATGATVDHAGSVYRVDDQTGVAEPESYDARLACASVLAGSGTVDSSHLEDGTFDEDALLDGVRLDETGAPTSLSQLVGELYADRTEVLATCGRVRDQRIGVAAILAALALTGLGLVAAYSFAGRRPAV